MQNPPHPPHQLNNSQHPTPKDVVAAGGHGVDEMMAQESKEEKSEAEEREEEKKMEEESEEERSEEVKRKEDLEKVE